MLFFLALVRHSEAQVDTEHTSACKTVLGSRVRYSTEPEQKLWMLQKIRCQINKKNIYNNFFFFKACYHMVDLSSSQNEVLN